MKILSSYYPRLDAPLKVQGKARYIYDISLPGMLYGAILTSPYPSAKIIRIDDSRVRKHPGVRAVLTDVHPTGRIRYAGEEVAAVAATSPEALQEALELFQVEYEVLPFVVDLEAAMDEKAPRVFSDRPNVRKPREREEGDIEKGFAEADVVVEREFRTQVQVHVPLEPHGSVVTWEGDQLIIYDSTQAVHGVREGVAKALDIPVSRVRVICEHMGGGFGSKLWAGRYTAIAARLSRQAGAPVKLMLTRKQDFLGAGNRPNSVQKIKMGARKDGTLVAFYAETYGTAGIATNANVRLPFIYQVPNWKHIHRDVFINAGGGRPFRAPGCPQASFSMEQMMDELAEKLGMDPLEFRLKNDPNTTRQKEWRIGAEKIGWSRRRKAPGSDPGPVKRGLGMAASIWWPGGRGTKASMTIYPDGSVEVRCGTQDIGTGTRTLVASVAAEELGIDMRWIRPLIGDSNYPYSGASGGSTTAPSVGPAIKNTAEKARAALLERVARNLGLAPEKLTWQAGSIRITGSQSQQLSWKEICQHLENEPLEVHGEWVKGLSSAGVAGCQFVEVAVDTETGQIQVEKVVAVADCGLVLNRLTTENQINGGILQGISYALLEERYMDPTTGTMVNPNYESYKILGAMETPEIEIILYDEPERGVIGIGEPPTIPTAAAIANAVYHAIGVRLRELPMTPDRVLNALYQEKKV
ncbi:MAG: xanthine dehydrogenase family protein molybdopterin-binding subunit [Calditrichaeota bacterium]|nr:xanthine dehydrogenase family protein molybdopterin-binding subunit [Calditrichota bacterium]